MNDLLGSLSVSASGMQAQSARLRSTSENIANVDTPGYHRKTIRFDANADGTLAAGRVSLDKSELEQVFDPSHPMADASGHYAGSNVDLIVEVADAREAQRSYEANLKLFDQARQMTQGLFDLIRK